MMRSRSTQVIAALAASLALAFFAAVSSSSHETDDEDEIQSANGTGPDLTKPIALPRSLSSLEIVLGLSGAAADEWEGEVGLSQGRVVDVAVVRSRPAASVAGSPS